MIFAAALRGSAGSMSAESSTASPAQKEKTQRKGAILQRARETSEHGVGT